MNLQQNQLLWVLGLLVLLAVGSSVIPLLPSMVSNTPSQETVFWGALIIGSLVVAASLLYFLLRLAGSATPTPATPGRPVSIWTIFRFLQLAVTLVGFLLLVKYLSENSTSGFSGLMPTWIPTWETFKSYLWWEPNLELLLQIGLVGLLLLWLVPKSSGLFFTVLKVVLIGLFAWYLFNSLRNSGFFTWVKETTVSTDACFKDPNCINYDGPVTYPSGKVIHLEHHLTKEKPTIFRFKGRVTLYNSKACTQPWIEKFGDFSELKIILPKHNLHHTYLESPRDKIIEVQVWLKPVVPCPRA